MVEVRHYVTATGKNVFESWLASLDKPAQARIVARIARLVAGNFGDCKSVQGGVSELRIDFGPGYRVYYAMLGRTCVLILAAGDKKRQSADIATAIKHLVDYKKRRRIP
jgi:putative addiction module killer protein